MLRICNYVPTLEYMLVDDETPQILCKSSDRKECERIKFMLEKSREDRVKHDVNNLKEWYEKFKFNLRYGAYDNELRAVVVITVIAVVMYFVDKV